VNSRDDVLDSLLLSGNDDGEVALGDRTVDDDFLSVLGGTILSLLGLETEGLEHSGRRDVDSNLLAGLELLDSLGDEGEVRGGDVLDLLGILGDSVSDVSEDQSLSFVSGRGGTVDGDFDGRLGRREVVVVRVGTVVGSSGSGSGGSVLSLGNVDSAAGGVGDLTESGS